MKTKHKIFFGDAAQLGKISDNSIHLTVTSPPYPMIQMWDECFSAQNPDITNALEKANGMETFELMHQILDEFWEELYRVMIDGGIVCINIGDASRNIGEEFRLYPNHMRIIQKMIDIGFSNLPNIIWRKPANSPTKFMGSGMLPPNAYMTLEHEYILIFRKGGKREFPDEEARSRRRESAIFWEERNIYFSDLWQVLGITQSLHDKKTRKRSAAFPPEIPFRLISMFSLYDDTVLDPFAGLGTTNRCAQMLARNSIGIELDGNLRSKIDESMADIENANRMVHQRINNHLDFAKEKGDDFFKHRSKRYNFPVKTGQETDQIFYLIENNIDIHSSNELIWNTSYDIASIDFFEKDFPATKKDVYLPGLFFNDKKS